MKILTWNINGIRASKRCLKDVLDSLDAHVICLQETKVTRDMLDEPSAIVDGYNAYFSFSRKKTGYSGTANFCKDEATPTGAEEGLSGQLVNQSEGNIGCLASLAEFGTSELLSLDGEGRAVITQHQIELKDGNTSKLAIINVYVPRATDRDERWTYKLRFLALLQSRAESLLRNGSHVIVLGDINTTHKRIDHCDPSSEEFLRIDSRQWVDQFLRPEDRDPDLVPIDDRTSFEAILSDAEGGHFIDTFRFFYPDKTEAYTHWSVVSAARLTNYGKRLDYIFIDTGLQEYLVDCHILADFEGSDHCPVVLEIQCKPVPAQKCPPLCTKLMPEFQGKQQKLFGFFSKSSAERESAAQPHTESEVVSSQSSASSSSPLPSALSSWLQLQRTKTEPANKSQQKSSLKRSQSSDKASDNSRLKKKKSGKADSNISASGVGSRQASLFNFFRKPTAATVNQSAKQSDDEDTASKYWQKDAVNSVRSTAGKTTTPLQESSEQTRSPSKLSLPSLSLIPSSPKPTNSGKESIEMKICKTKPKDSDAEESVPEKETSVCKTEESTNLPSAKPANSNASSLWKGLLSGPPPPPPCKGHKEPCVLRTVKKEGPNKGKQFYVCARPEGHSSNKEARCEHFQWVSYISSGKKT